MEQLRDIKDLEPISIWPLAYGWWLVIAVILAMIVFMILKNHQHNKFKNSWKFKAIEKLQYLRNNSNKPQAIADLFELLKEASIQKFGRKECANLTGDEWLKWLNKKDKFNWVKYGKKLVTIQYAPELELANKAKDKEIKKDINKMFDGLENLIKSK